MAFEIILDIINQVQNTNLISLYIYNTHKHKLESYMLCLELGISISKVAILLVGFFAPRIDLRLKVFWLAFDSWDNTWLEYTFKNFTTIFIYILNNKSYNIFYRVIPYQKYLIKAIDTMVRWYFYMLYEIKNISLLLKVYSYSLPKGEQNILIKNVKINYYISTNYCQVKKINNELANKVLFLKKSL